MITLGLNVAPDGGNKAMLDTSNLPKNFTFVDENGDSIIWNGSKWTGIMTEFKNGNEVILDGDTGYLQIDAVAVLSCTVNGVDFRGDLHAEFSPPRYYGFPNNIPSNIKLIIKR